MLPFEKKKVKELEQSIIVLSQYIEDNFNLYVTARDERDAKDEALKELEQSITSLSKEKEEIVEFYDKVIIEKDAKIDELIATRANVDQLHQDFQQRINVIQNHCKTKLTELQTHLEEKLKLAQELEEKQEKQIKELKQYGVISSFYDPNAANLYANLSTISAANAKDYIYQNTGNGGYNQADKSWNTASNSWKYPTCQEYQRPSVQDTLNELGINPKQGIISPWG